MENFFHTVFRAKERFKENETRFFFFKRAYRLKLVTSFYGSFYAKAIWLSLVLQSCLSDSTIYLHQTLEVAVPRSFRQTLVSSNKWHNLADKPLDESSFLKRVPFQTFIFIAQPLFSTDIFLEIDRKYLSVKMQFWLFFDERSFLKIISPFQFNLDFYNHHPMKYDSSRSLPPFFPQLIRIKF